MLEYILEIVFIFTSYSWCPAWTVEHMTWCCHSELPSEQPSSRRMLTITLGASFLQMSNIGSKTQNSAHLVTSTIILQA